MIAKLVSLVLVLLWANLGSAQKVDNTAFYRNISPGKSLRIHYENDFFSRSDIYYTQGINVEYYNPQLKKYLHKFLLHFKNENSAFGVAAEHLGFTPTSITFPSILQGDRPFAACLLAKAFSVSKSSTKRIQWSSTLTSGIIGPAAGGKEFQSTIHRWINDRQPLGWDNQIRNDIVLNYHSNIVKGIVDLNWFSLAGKVSGEIGTLNTKATAGFIVIAGLFANRWNAKAARKFQVYLYAEPYASLIAYDATLQGGVFNDTSPYTIASHDINRTVFQNNSGIIFVVQKFEMEYFQSFNTKEFNTARSHHWGGVRLSIKF